RARGVLAGARAAFDQAWATDPKSYSALSNLVEVDIREKRFEQAQARLEAAVPDHGGNPLLHLALARIREQRGAPIEEVRKTLAEAIRIAPNDVAARIALIDTNLRAKQLKEALIAAQAADAAITSDPEILDALGRTQALAGDQQQAITTFRRITNLETGSAKPHMRLAAMHREQGNLTAAIASLRRAIELDPSQAQARVDLVALLISNKQGAQAVQIARELQQRSPESESGYLLESAALERVQDRAGAIDALRKGAARAKAKGELTRQLFRHLLMAGREKEADAVSSEWIKRHPDDAGMQDEIGSSSVGRGDLDRAEKHLRLAIALRPDHPNALNNLAWVLVTRGKPGALPLAQRAVDLMPGQAGTLDTLALALAADKQFAEAIKTQKRAIEIAPGDMGLRMTLARIAFQAGDKDLARTELERLAALGSKVPFQAQVGEMMKQLR
ncbi:MAG: tetratricopeptide repeat protein, partial [Rhodocyclaceae bacterium]|nr:tetratricopeptide repeat protein [Rhodocyclaceae bacterium]